MANRSATHSWPLSGLIAIRCAVMSQQLLPSNQFGPSSGDEMTAGLRVETVTGATVAVIVAGNSGGIGSGMATPMACARVVGMLDGPPSAGLSTATSSHTNALCPGPGLVVGAGLPRMRVQYASLSPDSVSSVLSPASTASDVNVSSCASALVSCSS